MTALPRCWVALVFGAVFVSCAAHAEEPSRQELARTGKAASAFIKVKDRSGSGFCVHPSGLFVTNHHVIDSGSDVTIVLNPNRKEQKVVKARVVRTDRDADLALLQAEGVKDLPYLAVGDDAKLSEAAEVVACGFPFAEARALARDDYPAITITLGHVTSLRQKAGELELIQLDVELHAGNSGGPILGSDGKVVGVVAWAGLKGTKIQSAIPARKLQRFVAPPTVTFKPPAPPDDWQKPLPFEVRADPVVPSEKPFDIDLILRTTDGKERKHPMKGADDVYRAEAALLTDPAVVPMVCCTVAVSRDGKELARVSSWVFHESKTPRFYLADLPEIDFKKGTWELTKGTIADPPGTPIRVGGMKSPHGLSTHANSTVKYRLKRNGPEFRSRVSLDDTARPFPANEILFTVVGDGKVLWTSKPIHKGETDDCSVDVSGVDTLELVATVRGSNYGASAVWVEPHLLAVEGAFRAQLPVAIDDRDRTAVRLPAAIEDAVLGGGGRYLILSLPAKRTLAVFDLLGPREAKFITLELSGAVRIAAGADKLLVLYAERKVLHRYSLVTLKKDGEMDVPLDRTVASVAMGSASQGPFFLVRERSGFSETFLFLDVQRMRKMDVYCRGEDRPTGLGLLALASADGRRFGVGADHFSRAFQTVHFDQSEATIGANPDRPLYAAPGPDGSVVYTANGIYTGAAKDPEKGARHRGSICLPAAQGDFYLKATTDSFTLHLTDDDDPLVRVTGAGWPRDVLDVKDQTLPYFKRIFLVPSADLVVTIPAGRDREEVQFIRFLFAQALDRVTGDYLFVAPFAPPAVKKGEPFAYELLPRSKKGGVKYQVVSGQRGMTVSEKGKVEWAVPAGYPEGVIEVRIRVEDASGRQRMHSFQVRVE